jgi:hypothetical protein
MPPLYHSELVAIVGKWRYFSFLLFIMVLLRKTGQSHLTQFFQGLPPQNLFVSLPCDPPPTPLTTIYIEAYEED